MKALKHTALLSIILGAGLMISCEPQPDELQLLDDYVVSTYYDNETNFSSLETFFVTADTIGLLSDNPQDDTIVVGTYYARPVVQRVIDNMEDAGYTLVGEDENPDVVVKIYVVKNLNIYQQYNYYGPGYYNPYYYGYYNYYYGYPSVSTYAYNTGTLVIDLADFKHAGTGRPKIVWTAQMGDVFSSIDLLGQTNRAIDQAFAQSVYL
jgi:hypothetical protein